MSWLRTLLRIAPLVVLFPACIWAAVALFIDVPVHWLGVFFAPAFVALEAAALRFTKSRALAITLGFVLFAAVLGWWLTLSPSNDRPWQPDVARTAWAEIGSDRVTIHNFRNVDYTTETNYTAHWETRTVELSQILAMDLFMNYWGSPAIAHTILSFELTGGLPVAISIETRKEIGESYSALLGFFRQYELIYVIGDERDIVRVRTNYRKREDLYLFRTRATPARARAIFLDYLKTANQLRLHPRWYNAVTSNCTTNVVPHLLITKDEQQMSGDWRILFNGYADRMSYQQGRLAGNLPFDQLKRLAHINAAAQAADRSPEFSREIRAGRPGFP